MRKMSTLLIIIGIVVTAYPLLDRGYTWYMQRQIEQTYSDLGQVFETSEETGIPDEGTGTPSAMTASSATTPSSTTASATTQTTTPSNPSVTTQTAAAPVAPATPVAPVNAKKPVGQLLIPKINVKLPIMNGATLANMKIGAAWMKETTPIGQNGNAAIAAHRSQTKGRFFNRLDEVAVGDEIKIIAEGKEYKYTVFNIVVVEPSDVSVLKGKRSEQIITLITCTPLKVATHRLIVQARLVQ